MPRFTASSYLMYFFFGWYPIIHGWLKLGRVWTVKATNGWILIAMQRYMVKYWHNIQKEMVFLVESYLV